MLQTFVSKPLIRDTKRVAAEHAEENEEKTQFHPKKHNSSSQKSIFLIRKERYSDSGIFLYNQHKLIKIAHKPNYIIL